MKVFSIQVLVYDPIKPSGLERFAMFQTFSGSLSQAYFKTDFREPLENDESFL